MKACLLNDSFPPVMDGVATVILNYAKVLSEKEGAKVMVSVPRYPKEDYSGYPFPVIPYTSLPTEHLTGGYRTGSVFPMKELRELTAFQPDLIHVHSPASALFVGRSLRMACHAPLIFSYHTKYDIELARLLQSPLLQKEVIRELVRTISAADEVWTVSEGAGKNLRSLGYEGRYHVVRNGVDFPKGRIAEETVFSALKEYDLPKDLPVFLFVGRLMKYKGLPLLMDALAHLAQKKDFRMVLVGSGAEEGELFQYAKEKGLTLQRNTEEGMKETAGRLPHGKVLFVGSVKDREQLRIWNSRADLFVFPSTFDTSGLVVREAAACGLASVLIRGSCAAEGVEDGRNGYLSKADAANLCEVLLFACDHREEVKACGMRAGDTLVLSWQDAVHAAYVRYETILEEIQSGRRTVRYETEKPVFAMAGKTALLQLETSRVFSDYEGMMEEMDMQREENLLILQDSIRHLRDRILKPE